LLQELEQGSLASCIPSNREMLMRSPSCFPAMDSVRAHARVLVEPQSMFRVGSVPAVMSSLSHGLISGPIAIPGNQPVCMPPLPQGSCGVVEPVVLGPHSPSASDRTASLSPTPCGQAQEECWSQKVYLNAFKERALKADPYSLENPLQRSPVSPQQWLSGQAQTSTTV
jgi:hypothetical protein